MLASHLIRAAGNSSTPYIEDLYNAHEYTGTGASLDVVTGIDLSDGNGVIWIKRLDASGSQYLFDTVNGVGKYITLDNEDAQSTDATTLTAFNANGFTLGTSALVNTLGANYIAYTFKTQRRFVDLKGYVGTGTTQNISHDLTVTPGVIVVKNLTSASTPPVVYHKDIGNTGALYLSTAQSVNTSSFFWNNASPTPSRFTVGTTTFTNETGSNFIALLFADDPDGSFGDGSNGLISCGSYTGDGVTGRLLDIGVEPQFWLSKANQTEYWIQMSTLRHMHYGHARILNPNVPDAEFSGATGTTVMWPDKNQNIGFAAATVGFNETGVTYYYMAVRSGPMKFTNTGTDVFAMDTRGSTGSGVAPAYRSTFTVDMALHRDVSTTAGLTLGSRKRPDYGQQTNTTASFPTTLVSDANYSFAYSNGWNAQTTTDSNDYSWMFRRAAGVFDHQFYTGNGISATGIRHNLRVKPQLMIIRSRYDTTDTENWIVHVDPQITGSANNNDTLTLNTSNSWTSPVSDYFGNTLPTRTHFYVGTHPSVNYVLWFYEAFLFGTTKGVSKVGGYTGNGSTQTIDCDFTTGARFILIKRYDDTGSWYIWDSVRGIVSGNDPFIEMNTTAAQDSSTDSVDPDNSGFIVNQNATTNINVNAAEYVFFAIS